MIATICKKRCINKPFEIIPVGKLVFIKGEMFKYVSLNQKTIFGSIRKDRLDDVN